MSKVIIRHEIGKWLQTYRTPYWAYLSQEAIPETVPGSLAPSCSDCDASCFLWAAQCLALVDLALEGGEVSLMGEQHLGLKCFVI